MDAGLQLVLAIDDHLLARREAGIDERSPAAHLGDFDRPHRDRAVRVDDIDVWTLRSLLHRRRGHRQPVMPRVEEQPRIDQLSGPQFVLFVGKVGSEPDASCRLHDFVVDEIEAAFIELHRVVLTVSLYFECAVGQVLLNLRQARFRQREDHRDRFDLRGYDEAVRIGWMNDIADVDLSYAGHSVDRRGELRIAELRLRPFDRRLVGLDGRLQLLDLRLLGLDQLRSGPALITQRAIPFEIGLRVRQLSLIAGAVRVRLIELRLIRTRIDHGEQIAGLHGLPFGEVDFGDLPLDLAADDHGVVGDHRADALQIDRHVAAVDGAGNDGNGWDRRRGCRRRLGRKPMRDARAPTIAARATAEIAKMMTLRRIACSPCRRLRISKHRKTLTARYYRSPDTGPG